MAQTEKCVVFSGSLPLTTGSNRNCQILDRQKTENTKKRKSKPISIRSTIFYFFLWLIEQPIKAEARQFGLMCIPRKLTTDHSRSSSVNGVWSAANSSTSFVSLLRTQYNRRLFFFPDGAFQVRVRVQATDMKVYL